MRPSLTLIFSCLFLIFMLHSIWNLIGIFRAPTCSPGDICYSSYLNTKPKLQLLVYTTDSQKSFDGNLILHLRDFLYEESLERFVNTKDMFLKLFIYTADIILFLYNFIFIYWNAFCFSRMYAHRIRKSNLMLYPNQY